MRGNSGFIERSAESYLPYLGHIRPYAVVLDGGAVLMVAELHGQAHELAAASERNAAARFWNGLYRNIQDDTLTVGAYLVRHQRVKDPPPRRFRNAFSADLYRTYCERVLKNRLYKNTWYLSIIVSPRVPGTGRVTGRKMSRTLARWRRRAAAPAPELLVALDDLWATLARSLEGFGLRRLGLREHNGVLFSEIAEALRLILYGEFLPVPLVSGLLGNAIYADRVIFGRRAFEIRAPGAARFGAIFGLREYMMATRPGMLDAILSLPMTLVLSQSFGFLARPDALGKLSLKTNQMVAAADKAKSQVEGLIEAQDRLASGEFTMGMHHLSLAVYGNSLAELDGHASAARSALADSGAVVVQESLGMEAAYFAQLPGNTEWRPRPGAISSRNFAHLAGFGAFPTGSLEGFWR